MSVQEYIDKHELTKRVEDAINATVKAKPDEPLSFLVSIADQCEPVPLISCYRNRRPPASPLRSFRRHPALHHACTSGRQSLPIH